ncbi:DUF6942 family protein [Thalassotalea montiporae]
MHYVGLGSLDAPIYFYIENIPPLPFYQNLDEMFGMQGEDIYQVGQQTGNHWRKVFNVFAKLEFERNPNDFMTWQQLRDTNLLHCNGQQCLLFNGSESYQPTSANHLERIHIVIGKTYADKLGVAAHCQWLNEFFAINTNTRTIVCPYFDYRQLSNIKISQLVRLIQQL